MLHKRTIHALKALLELADDPLRWRSCTDLAAAQDLPESLLEQVLLQLRRAGVLSARRGRLGGYRLSRSARAIAVVEVVLLMEPASQTGLAGGRAQDPDAPQSADPGKVPEGSGAERRTLPPSAQVTRALERRLQQALLRSLEAVSLEDLLYDLRSAEAACSESGGLLLG